MLGKPGVLCKPGKELEGKSSKGHTENRPQNERTGCQKQEKKLRRLLEFVSCLIIPLKSVWGEKSAEGQEQSSF